MKQPTIITLGRLGDIVNALPAAYSLSRKGARPRFVVSKQFRSILDGVSYVDPVEFDGDYTQLPEAIRQQRAQGFDPLVFQAYKNPDQRRHTDSYSREGWRIAGFPTLYGAIPLVFDRRDKEAECEIIDRYVMTDRPLILTSLKGISSPFPMAQELRNLIDARCADYEVVEISEIKANHPHDLIALIDKADLLVSIDTLHLHLAKAAHTPVIALINNGWFGSVPPPQSVTVFRYRDAVADLFKVGDAVFEAIERQSKSTKVVQVVSMYGKSDRHRRAQASWPSAWSETTITNLRSGWGRSSKDIGDSRELPYLSDILQSALELTQSEDDCVVWTNDDVELKPRSLEDLRKHVTVWDAVSMRRLEPGVEGVHMGRELFAFRAGWLRYHLPKIPDYFIGTESFDLGLAAYIRYERGIPSTHKNLSTDFFPCELPAGLALHEPHESAWASMTNAPASVHNRKLLRTWASRIMPSLKFNETDQICP